MEKVSATHFLRFWAVLGLFALVLIWFLPWRFQTNDDELMMWLVSGAYTGTPESYAVFIHPILSWIFSELYTALPDVPWYPLTWFGVLYLSYLGIVISLTLTESASNFKQLFILFVLLLVLHFGITLQFTVVAGMAGFSGMLLFEVGRKNNSLLMPGFSLLLLIFSILIRWESFFLISLGYALYFLCYRSLSEFRLYAKFFILPALLFLVLFGGKLLWEKQADYLDFIAYNKARAAVSDHPVTHRLISEMQPEEEPTWFYFSQWMMENDRLTTQDLLERKIVLDSMFFSLEQLNHSFARLISILKTEAFKSVFTLLFFFLYFYRFRFSKNSLFFFLAWILFFITFNHFYVLNGRVIILYLFPFWFPFILEEASSSLSKKNSLLSSYLLLLLFGYHFFSFLTVSKGREIMQREFESLTAQLPEQSLLVLEGYKENYLGIKFSKDNPVSLLSLGWISKSPFQTKKLEQLGLQVISDADEYYLIGVDIHEEYFFPDYMNYVGEGYQLESKTELDNFILFHYIRTN
ncbi:hypothetical protein [Algoriphagus sp.]|uniref:hypothetical protein n=2 Tax=Algoriphagus sp. TaxID=1872435 RepID=UPI00327F7C5C